MNVPNKFGFCGGNFKNSCVIYAEFFLIALEWEAIIVNVCVFFMENFLLEHFAFFLSDFFTQFLIFSDFNCSHYEKFFVQTKLIVRDSMTSCW